MNDPEKETLIQDSHISVARDTHDCDLLMCHLHLFSLYKSCFPLMIFVNILDDEKKR